jgi:hypothetical protein
MMTKKTRTREIERKTDLAQFPSSPQPLISYIAIVGLRVEILDL